MTVMETAGVGWGVSLFCLVFTLNVNGSDSIQDRISARSAGQSFRAFMQKKKKKDKLNTVLIYNTPSLYV